MTNKEIKIIYILSSKGKSQREIKKILKNKYKLDVFQNDINRVCRKINIKKREKYNEKEKNKILYLYSKIINTDKLISYLNSKYEYELTKNKIRDLAHRNGVVKEAKNMYSQSYITRNNEYEIARLYNSGMSSNEIAKLYSYKTRNSILQKLEKMKIKRRNCNELRIKSKSYGNFDIKFIDTEFKAYLIGLMLTDGYVNSKRKYFGIDLIDEDCIKFLCDEINCKYSVIRRKGVQDKYRIIIYGEQYLNQLKRFAIVERKTFALEKPKLKKEEYKYIAYLIRGVIDGDGWIRKDGKEFFICSASAGLINWYKECLEYIGMEKLKITWNKNEYNGFYLIRTARKFNLEILKNTIYNKNFGMYRKYKIISMKDAQRL